MEVRRVRDESDVLEGDERAIFGLEGIMRECFHEEAADGGAHILCREDGVVDVVRALREHVELRVPPAIVAKDCHALKSLNWPREGSERAPFLPAPWPLWPPFKTKPCAERSGW